MRIALVGLAALALLATSGCWKSPVAEHWGEAYHANNEKMIANPEAGHEEPVVGLDGTTAEQAVVNYRKQQTERRSATTSPSIINIGTGGN